MYIRFIFLGFITLWGSYSNADWINLTGAESAPNIAEIYILDDHIKVNLEIYIGDLKKFEELVPDSLLKHAGSSRPTLEQRMQMFATDGLQFVTGDGTRLSARLKVIEPRMRVDRRSAFAGRISPFTGRKVQAAPADKRVLYAEIIYPFPKNSKTPKPEQLQIIPPLDADGLVTTNIGFVAFHKAVPIVDFRYLGQTATLNLDWQDPWYTKFDNKNLSRHHKYPLMLYLYIEPRQVRLESLMRFSDIAEMTGFELNGSNINIEDKLLLLQGHVKNYFADKETLQIDNKATRPDSVRVDFIGVTLSGLKVLNISTLTDESSLLVGVSQHYLIESLPQKVATRWQYFNRRIDLIPTIVTDPAGPLPGLIDKNTPELAWQNFLKKYTELVIQPVEVKTGWSIDIPYIGETKILNWVPEQDEALNIVSSALENVRIAFIEKEPVRFTQTLAKVVSSEKADVMKKELSKLFSPTVIGGGVGAVQAFDGLRVDTMQELDNPDGFSATVSGTALIMASHWGHVDRRTVQFQALLDLIEYKGQWRLADLTIIDIKQAK